MSQANILSGKTFLDNPPDQIGMVICSIMFGILSFYNNSMYYLTSNSSNNYVILVPIYTILFAIFGSMCGRVIGNTYPIWILMIIIIGPLYLAKHYIL